MAVGGGDTHIGVVEAAVRLLRSQWWLWLVPLVVLYATTSWPMSVTTKATAAVVALGVFAWAVRRPGHALIALVVFLPLQTAGFGFLLALHVPRQVLRYGGGLKELLVASILIAALHALHLGRTREGRTHQLDAIDKALLAYVAVVSVYLVVPHLFTSFYVSPSLSVRLLSWRADCGYVLLFFAVRHAPISDATRRQFVKVLLAMAAIALAGALYQWLDPQSWSHFILTTGRQGEYETTVLGNSATTVSRNLGYLTNLNPLRVGSIFLSPFDLADFLLIPLAIVVERIVRNRGGWTSYVWCAVILMALYATRVRADAVGAVAIALIALIPAATRPIKARLRLLGAVLIAAAVIGPALVGTRFVNAQGGAQSNQVHVSELSGGVNTLVRDPLGLGIGDVAGVGDRFVLQQPGQTQGAFTVDNSVLQVGDELGLQALVPWLVLLILVWFALCRAARKQDPFAGGVRLAFLAVLVAGMYHQAFLTYPVPWILWAAVGLALRPSDDGRSVRRAAPTAAVHAGDAGGTVDNIGRLDSTPAREQG
jgi:hypothetical protein